MEKIELTRADVEMVLAIAKEREDWVRQLRQAILDGDIPEAIRLGRLVCGLPVESTQ